MAQLFTAAIIDQIVEAVGNPTDAKTPKTTALAEDLEDAAGAYSMRCALDQTLSRKGRLKKLTTVQGHLEKLAKAFELPDLPTEPGEDAKLAYHAALSEHANVSDIVSALGAAALQYTDDMGPYPGIEPLMDNGAAEALGRAIEGIQHLRAWSRSAVEILDAQSDGTFWTGKNGFRDVSTMTVLVGSDLPEIYENHYGLDYGVSTRADKLAPYGPGIRFVQAVQEVLGLNLSPASIRSARNDIKNLKLSGRVRAR